MSLLLQILQLSDTFKLDYNREEMLSHKHYTSHYNNRDAQGRKFCLYCGKYLVGRQRRYCCEDHLQAFYDLWCEKYDWNTIRARVFARDNGKCVICGKALTLSTAEIHHIKARYKGGKDEDDNLETRCHKCHRKATNKLLKEVGADIREKNERLRKEEIDRLYHKITEYI